MSAMERVRARAGSTHAPVLWKRSRGRCRNSQRRVTSRPRALHEALGALLRPAPAAEVPAGETRAGLKRWPLKLSRRVAERKREERELAVAR